MSLAFISKEIRMLTYDKNFGNHDRRYVGNTYMKNRVFILVLKFRIMTSAKNPINVDKFIQYLFVRR